jgi:PilZ domain-containing protein
MPVPVSPQKERQALTTDPGRRRSMRVLLSVPIAVTGKAIDQKEFTEEARTLVVNAHGALISLEARVVVNQEITISNKATRQTLECRVVHVGNAQGGRTQLGVEFVRASPTFWQIDFPPDDWVVPED